MKLLLVLLHVLLTMTAPACVFADCNCDDWVLRGGYCVDYVKARVPSFPFPQTHQEMLSLNNRETWQIADGDVAIFFMGSFWHVAIVERVYLDRFGAVTAVDVSEMNYGRPVSQTTFSEKWGDDGLAGWERAVCCGVTEGYAREASRKMVDIATVRQVWSPVAAELENTKLGDRLVVALDRVADAVSHLCSEVVERCSQKLHLLI